MVKVRFPKRVRYKGHHIYLTKSKGGEYYGFAEVIGEYPRHSKYGGWYRTASAKVAKKRIKNLIDSGGMRW